MSAPIDGAMNVDDRAVVRPDHYRSDSNAHWRHGCPHDALAAGEFEWLQLLIHPEIWVYDGETMGETMESFLDADQSGPPRAPAGRQDRPLVKPITVVVTASGAPGTAALLRALRENGEREVRLVGTDMSERSVGRHLCDAFHLVPAGSDPVVSRGGAGDRRPRGRGGDPASVVLRPRRARRRASTCSTECLCSSRPLEAIERSNDKASTYELLHRLGLPAPEFRRVRGAAAVEAAARELGYPDRPVCFKPVFSSGSRGFRILDPTVDRAHQLLHERPGSVSMRLEDAVEILRVSRRPDRPARDGARDRRGADDRRDRERPRDRARASEDARGDARRARDVLRHARGSRA